MPREDYDHNLDNLREKGKADSEAVFGNVEILRVHLNIILSSHETITNAENSQQKKEVNNLHENLSNKISSIASLNNLKTQKEEVIANLDTEFNQTKTDTITKISTVNSEIEKLESEINILSAGLHSLTSKNKAPHTSKFTVNEIPLDSETSVSEKISNASSEEIPDNKKPESSGVTVLKIRSNKIAYYTCGTFLVSLTILLFLVYNSVSYSAFFRDPLAQLKEIQANIDEGDSTSENTQLLVTSIINFDGFSRISTAPSLSQRATGILLLLLFPALPLTLGFLGHSYRNSWKKYLFYALALAYDCLLAYKLVNDINIAKAALNRKVLPDWDIYTIFSTVFSENFGLVIFSTFVVYFFWAILFDKFISMNDETLPIKAEINAKKKEIELLKDKKINVMEEEEKLLSNIRSKKVGFITDIQHINEDIQASEIKMSEITNRIKRLESQIPLDFSHFELDINEYFVGWIEHVSRHYKTNDRDSFIAQCLSKQIEFLNEVKNSSKYYAPENNNHK